MEKRIIDIEKKISFFEHELAQLNEVVIDQQKKIDNLVNSLEEIRHHNKDYGLVKDLKDEVPPPHY